jgi:hypothetical protein
LTHMQACNILILVDAQSHSYRAMAQLGSALAWGARGRQFKSG